MEYQNNNRKQELLNSILKGKLKKEAGSESDEIIHTNCKSAPLSYAQRRMWFLHQLNREDDAYNMHSVLKMTGELDKDALTYSLLKIVERHDILRTNFQMNEEGEPIQVVNENREQTIRTIDMSECEEEGISEYIAGELAKPFDLEKDLLIKAILIKKSEDCHYLVVIMHHIVSDGWSFAILGQELMRYYNRYQKREYSMEPLKLQYIDYTFWQQKYLSTGRMERQCEYWKQKLTPLPEPLELKVRKQSETSEVAGAEKYSFHIDEKQSERLKELCKRTGTTLYMALLTVYIILLNKYSFQEDFIIGTPVANRRRKELEDLIGFFVNTLPIRIKLDTKGTFEEVLQGVKKETVGAFSNQDIPFEYIVKEVVGERYGEQVPVIQTMFVLQNTRNVEVTLPDVTVETQIYENTLAKFDLLLVAIEMNQGIQLFFEYKTDIFDASFIQSVADKYLLLLDEVLENRAQSVCLLGNTEEAIINKDALFDTINEFTAQNMVERFRQIAEKNANRTAVYWNGEEISYTGLEQRSNQLSCYINHLLDNGESFIGLCMERSIDMIVSILAILKSGCAYVPLDPDAPKERLDFIVKDAGLKLIIGHQEKLEHILIEDKILVIDIQNKQEEISRESDAALVLDRTPASSAYMIYTSGSTGNPKGVIVSDYNILRLFSNTDNLYHFGNNDVWVMFHSVAFDFSVWEIWGALLYGGELVIVPYKTSRTPEVFLQLLLERKVTVLNQTPSAFRQLLQCDAVYDKETVEQMKLRYIIFGGEALDFGMLEQWMDTYGEQAPQLVNMYGITETTVHVTYEVLDKNKIKNTHQSIIGMPIKDLQIYILDEQMRMVPDGVVGEMYVGGAGVSKGYWNREELTAERFIQNPFLKQKNILYKTGDLACRHTNGNLEYIGRNDGQVKVKGFRIELNEIQEKINQNSLVKDNTVILDKIEDDARIISYLTLDKDAKKEMIQELLERADYDMETEEIFDHNYQQNSNIEDDRFNIIGWNNSYDNEQMTEEEMREWLDSICQKLYEIPMKAVLEIGVGTGMILHRLADRAERYVGLDISGEAIEYNKRIIKKLGLNYKNVELIHTSVEKLEDKVEHSFDTVIINSVAQYFPDVSYFEKALYASIERIQEYGHIIVGDVRSFNRLSMYYLSVELSRLDQGESIAVLRRNIDTRKENEKELIFAHSYFRELQDRIPQITLVEMTPKMGDRNNELSKYRYDVVLTIDKRKAAKSYVDASFRPERVDWIVGRERIKSFAGKAIHLVNIPDERVEYEERFLKNLYCADEQITIENYSKLLKGQKSEALSNREIQEITAWAQQKGYHVHIGVDNVPGCLDLVLYQATVAKETVIEYLNSYYGYDINEEKVTEPLKYKVQYQAVEKITGFLQDKLPYYMIPNEFVLIERIPLTINGKIDYEALPKPNSSNRVLMKKEEWCEEYIIQEVTRVWKNLLHIEEIQPEDNFFQLGGHSLLATNLIFSLNDIFKVRIPLKYLFEEPTIMGISRFIQSKLDIAQPLQEKELNLEKDVYLPEAFALEETLTSGEIGERTFSRILVTGATGFFGAFLVQRLLEETTAVIYCLVRAKDEKHARARLIDIMKNYKIYDEACEKRIVVLCGDLSLPYFGMDKSDYDNCAEQVDTIIHNGAKVNFFEPYEALRNTNVNGTQEIVKLAAAHRIKPIHFISTLYVHEPSKDSEAERLIDEEQPLTGYQGLRMGYTQSKWVAERILNLAREQGLPVNIYRLGRISGHSKTGACQQKDFIWSLVKGCIETGVYPNQNLEFEFTPVDYLTQAVVQIMKSKELNTNYHLFNHKKTSLQSIVRSMSDQYRIRPVNRESWLESMAAEESSARHLTQLLSDGTFDGGYLHFRNDHVVIHMPSFKDGIQVSDEMLKALRDYFVETKYFPREEERMGVVNG